MRAKRKHRATFSYPMFSGGEKNSFYYFFVIGKILPTALTLKPHSNPYYIHLRPKLPKVLHSTAIFSFKIT